MNRLRGKPLYAALFLAVAISAALWGMNDPDATTRSIETLLKEPAQPNAHAVPDKQPEPTPPPKPKALSDHVTEYHIDVRYEPERRLLIGTQTVTWKNPGTKPVSELYLHLYPNAFASNETTFMRESKGRLRDDQFQGDRFGGMTISSMQGPGGKNLLPFSKFVQPDDGNKHDQTLMRVALGTPVQPQDKATITVGFEVVLPHPFARMGAVDDFVMAGQWFPKIAVYEKSGMRGRESEGWNLHQYHGNSEFYADFGIYNVAIHVPDSYIVAASGFPTKKAEAQDGWKTYRYYADDVHDFAWAASPNFVYAEQSYADENVPGLKIKLYLDPLHADLKDRYFYAVKRALALYSKWYGSYPYSTLSIVVPPADANGAGGMEYPTLITAWGAKDDNPDSSLERVVVHEIAHQYWYGMVATNEFEEAWLDEAFASYAEDKIMREEFGEQTYDPLLASYVTSPSPLYWNAWQYDTHEKYAENVYTRGMLVLKAIERQIGAETMDRVLKRYFQNWKFKHPSTDDFKRSLENVTKQDWTPFFQEYVYQGNMFDASVEDIQVSSSQDNGSTVYHNVVTLARNEGLPTQVSLQLRFADGHIAHKAWDGKDERFVFRIDYGAPLLTVKLDPRYELPLENRHMNNFMSTELNETASNRMNVGISTAIELLMSWIAW